MENELRHIPEQIKQPIDWRRLKEMALIRSHFIEMTSRDAMENLDMDSYKAFNNPEWFSSHGAGSFRKEIARFVKQARRFPGNPELRQDLAEELAFEGKVKEARKLKVGITREIAHNFLRIREQIDCRIALGCFKREIKQRKLEKAFNRTNRSSVLLGEVVGMWQYAIENANPSDREKVGKLIKERFNEEFSAKVNYPYTVGELINKVVLPLYRIGQKKTAHQVLNKIGKCALKFPKEEYDSLDYGPSYPQREASNHISRTWIELGDLKKAEKWLNKANPEIDKEARMVSSLFSSSEISEEELIERVEKLEKDKDKDTDKDNYVWEVKEWLETHLPQDSKKIWSWFLNKLDLKNSLISEDWSKKVYPMSIRNLIVMAQNVKDKDIAKMLFNYWPTDEEKIDNIGGLVEICMGFVDMAKEEGNLEEVSEHLKLAIKSLSGHRFSMFRDDGEVLQKLFETWLELRNWNKSEDILSFEWKDPLFKLLAFKCSLLYFELRYGGYDSQKVDFSAINSVIRKSGWDQGNGDDVVLLLKTNEDLEKLLFGFSEDENTLAKIRIASVYKEKGIKNKSFEIFNSSWVQEQISKHLCEQGQISKEIVEASVKYLVKWGETSGKKYLIDLCSHMDWWESDNMELRQNLKMIIFELIQDGKTHYIRDEIVHFASEAIFKGWKDANVELLGVARQVIDRHTPRDVINNFSTWVVDHIDDLRDQNKDAASIRMEFFINLFDFNVSKNNYLGYQLLGENIYSFEQSMLVIKRLSEQGFFEDGVADWWNNYVENNKDRDVQEKTIKEIGKMVRLGIFPKKEILEDFFSVRGSMSFEEKVKSLHKKADSQSQAFKSVFMRDINDPDIRKIIKQSEIRCLIGSVYGKPVMIMQNFQNRPQVLPSHEWILNSWRESEGVRNTEIDSIVQKHITNLFENSEVPVAHFLRGFIRIDTRGNLVFRSDAQFDQSSASSRSQLVSEVGNVTREFGINRLEQIPENEYAELQRSGFFRGAVSLQVEIIRENLGDKDARIFERLATAYYVEQAFNQFSPSYERLESYLKLIDLYRGFKSD